MIAEVRTSGGEVVRGIPTVIHWSLHVDGRWIADSSNERDADLFRQIADRINR